MRLVRRMLASRPRIVSGGVKMHVDPLEWSQAELLQGRATEPATIQLMKEILKDGYIYVDVGAHVGYHSLIARTAIGPKGLAVLVEPQPYNCARILANWRSNCFDNLVLFTGLAGNSSKRLVILSQQGEIDTSRLSLVFTPVYDETRRFAVSMTTLSEILEELNVQKIHLLKVDVEGMEGDVLRGLGDYISVTDNIIMELLDPSSLRDNELPLLFDDLRSSGFEFVTVRGNIWNLGELLPENNLWIRRVR